MKGRVFLYSLAIAVCYFLMISNLITETAYSNPLTYQGIVTSAITPHSPIVINHIDNFTQLGLPGNGTQDDPFLIEGYTIYGITACINITGTSAYVNVQDCVLYGALGFHDVFGVFLWNVSNCRIISCEISVGYWGVRMYNCEMCGVYESDIEGADVSILIEESKYCTVSSNYLHGYADYGLIFDDCNYSLANSNSIFGEGIGDTGIAIYDNSWYCIIANSTVTGQTREAMLLRCDRCLVKNNTITNNRLGILILDTSSNNTITLNTLAENSNGNVADYGVNNSWVSNWYDDYLGIGFYEIPGSAKSIDYSPQPQNIALILSVVAIPIIMTSLIIVLVWKRYRRN